MLQRDVDSAARAMLADPTIKGVNVASLNKWLRGTAEGEGRNKVTNEAKHKVTKDDLAAIQERYAALAKESGSAKPKPKPDDVAEEKKGRGGLKAKREVVMFPHDGKHQPAPGLVGRPKQLAAETAKRNAVALYKSNDPATVITWETEAIEKGLTLHDNFTIVYGFKEAVGADGGEMTRFIRMEGHHHGHPIRARDTSVSTAFDSYIESEIEHAKGKPARLQEIREFLTRVDVPHGRYRFPAEKEEQPV